MGTEQGGDEEVGQGYIGGKRQRKESGRKGKGEREEKKVKEKERER